jgi:hypothetical protein
MEYLEEVDTILRRVAAEESHEGRLLPQTARFILGCVVQPAAEYIPTNDEKYWIVREDIPRIVTVAQIVSVSNLLAQGRRDLLNLRAINL